MTKKGKTFEQMLEAYKEIHKQVIEAELEDIASVNMSEYIDPVQHNHWVVIEVNIGVGREFPVDRCKYIRIDSDYFDKGMANFKKFIAEYINKPNN